MILRNFWYARHDLPLRGINFEPYRAIKMPTPDGVGISMVRPTRFERATYRVGVCHSIQLSYGRVEGADVSARILYQLPRGK